MLVGSGRFVVVEWAVLSEIQREQQLGAPRLAAPEIAAEVGVYTLARVQRAGLPISLSRVPRRNRFTK